MSDFNQFNIPFGKYLDPNILSNIKLIKSEVIEDNMPIVDELYLIKDSASDIYCCAYEPETVEPNYHGSIAKEIMEKFVKTELGENASVELLKPKNEYWLPTHYLAVIHLAK